MDKKVCIYTTISLAFAVQSVFANANFQYANPAALTSKNSNLQGYILYVPTGTRVNAVLSQEINSNTATVGQNISAILMDDLQYKGQLVASSGSVISGSVVSNTKSAIGGKNAQTQIRFTTIRTPYNNVIPISAIIVTSDSTGILKGGTAKDTTKEYVKDAAKSTSADTLLRTDLEPLSKEQAGKSTVYDAAGNGGLNTAKADATKGEDIRIPANSQIAIVFEQPITLGAQ